MTLAQERRHHEKKTRKLRHEWTFGSSVDWAKARKYRSGYELEEEWCDQLDRLPSREHIDELLSLLRVATLRELSKEVVNGSVDHLKGDANRLEYIRLLNSWIATAEETVAAGKGFRRIAARRRGKAS